MALSWVLSRVAMARAASGIYEPFTAPRGSLAGAVRRTSVAIVARIREPLRLLEHLLARHAPHRPTIQRADAVGRVAKRRVITRREPDANRHPRRQGEQGADRTDDELLDRDRDLVGDALDRVNQLLRRGVLGTRLPLGLLSVDAQEAALKLAGGAEREERGRRGEPGGVRGWTVRACAGDARETITHQICAGPRGPGRAERHRHARSSEPGADLVSQRDDISPGSAQRHLPAEDPMPTIKKQEEPAQEVTKKYGQELEGLINSAKADGHVTYEAVAQDLGYAYAPILEALKGRRDAA